MNDRKTAAVRELLKKTRNAYDIAEELNLKVGDVRGVMKDGELEELPGWGKTSLQRFVVSRRRAQAPEWPISDQVRLAECRRLHDQGRVTMCQGRDGDWIIQYAIPTRGRPLRRAAYFSGG